MVENLQNGFYQLENKQAKSDKLSGNVNQIGGGGRKMIQNFLQST